jgi:D-xylonolactonase
VTVVVEHRRGIGGIALHQDGGLIVSGRNVAYKDRRLPTLWCCSTATSNSDHRPQRPHHGRVRPHLRGLAMLEPLRLRAAAELDARVAPRHRHRRLLAAIAEGIPLTNGLGFSPDGGRLHHSDSRAHIVDVYDVRPDGSVGPRQAFARVDQGVPDGLAFSGDGAVWVAAARGGAVLVFEPDGRRRERIRCPLSMVTSVCFGGDDLRDLYVVTGAEGADSSQAGGIFQLRVAVAGLPVPRAQVKLP